MANNSPFSEQEIFRKNYAKFCKVLKHEDDLLSYLVEKHIISWDDLYEIKSKNTADKGPTLLKHISGPLEANHTQGFYELLEVMITHGKVDTQEFARKIKDECLSKHSKPSTDDNDGQHQPLTKRQMLMESTDKSERKIPKDDLMYTFDDLTLQTKHMLEEFDDDILDKHSGKNIIDGVRLLLMVVNSSEFYAAMNYFSKNKARKLVSNGDIYYIGKWGKIPAALIQQSKSGTSGPDGSMPLTIASIKLFKNIEVIISLGVCGTMGRLGDVIVSSHIDGCDDIKIKGNNLLIINRAIKCQPGRKIYKCLKHNHETWSFLCTKQGTDKHEAKAVLKPMLSGVHLVASAEYRDKLKKGVNIEAGGLEMEGIGVIHGIASAEKKDKIEFIIVKAGCDYADEEKSKEWQPVAAMAAADFVYRQLNKPNWLSVSIKPKLKQDEVETIIKNNPSPTLKDVCEVKEKPQLIHLNRIFVKKYATEWKDFAIQLGIPTKDLEIIEKDNPDDIQECCRLMLLVWLQRDPQASWKRLHDVLEAYYGTTVKFSGHDSVATAFMILTSELTALLKQADFATVRQQCLIHKRFPQETANAITFSANLNELLDILVVTPYFSWIDIRLLEAMVTASGITTARKIIENYKRVIYEKKLQEVWFSLPVIQSLDTRYYSKLVTTLDKDLHEITVAYLLEFRSKLEEMIGVDNGICILGKIMAGSIIIDWFIPIFYTLLAYINGRNNMNKLRDFHLAQLRIDNNLLISSSDEALQIQRYLNQAKQLGHVVQLKHLTVLLVGTSGVGKTSFLKVLQGDDPPKEHNPTNAQESKKVMMPSKIGVQSDDTWITLSRNEQIAEIKKRLVSRSLRPEPNQDKINNNEDATSANEADTTDSDIDDTTSDEGVKTNSDHHNEDDRRFTDSIHQDKYPAKPDTSFSHEEKSTLNNEIINCSVTDEPSETWNILTIIDTAGQPEFINLLPAINKLAKITFVVFNMQSGLDNDVAVNRGDQNKDKDKVYYSNLHAIKCLLSMVNHSSECDDSDNDKNYKEATDKFQICLVGTHYDKVIGKSEVLTEMQKKIDKTIKELKIDELCFIWDSGDGAIYKIDAHRKYSKEDDGDIAKTTTKTIKAIRKQINEVIQESSKNISMDIKLNWLLLELQIQEECEKNKIVYMEWEQITDLIRKEKLSMTDRETKLALQYLHNTGFLLYFPESGQDLSNIVFPNPNYLFECLTKLINITRNGKCNNHYHVQELKNKGKLHKSLLHEDILFEEKTEKIFPEGVVEILLVLLEHLKILTKHPEQKNTKSTIYFMPCVLPSFDLSSMRDDEVESLHIRFAFGMIPRGVFCFLIVALLKEKNIFEEIVGERVYNNLIEIQTNTTDLEIVKIIDQVDSFDITVQCNDGKVKDIIYYQVWHDVSCALMNVWKNFKLSGTRLSDSSYSDSKPPTSNASLSDFSFEYGFRCGCHECKPCTASLSNPATEMSASKPANKKPCVAFLTEMSASKPTTEMTAKCEQTGVKIKLKDRHTIWFVFKLHSLKILTTTSTTVTLQWNSPVLASKYLLKYNRCSNAEQSSRLEISRDDCTYSNKCVEYSVCNLSSNTKYQFQVAMVNELGIEGEFTDIIEACTDVSYTLTSTTATIDTTTTTTGASSASNVSVTSTELDQTVLPVFPSTAGSTITIQNVTLLQGDINISQSKQSYLGVEQSRGVGIDVPDISNSTTGVDYHRLLWQELNKNFGSTGGSSIFVMAVGQQLSSFDYSIINDHAELADKKAFELIDCPLSCGTNYSPTGSSVSGMWKRLLDEVGPRAGSEHQPAFENARHTMRQELMKNSRSVIDYFNKCLEYYNVSLTPSDWYQWFDPLYLDNKGWTQINADSKNNDTDQLQAALYEKLGGSVTSNKHCDATISLKVRAVGINRPWLDLSILNNENYTIRGEKPGSWSTGVLNAENKGSFPLLSTQMIVAKDIKVIDSTEMEHNAITNVLFGSNSDNENNTVIIGYVCTLVPKFPH